MQMPWCVEAPTALSTREAQVNSTARCQLTPVRRAVKNKTGNNKPAKTRMQGRSGCKGTSVRHTGRKPEKAMAPTPVFSPGESQGRGSLVGCRLWGRTESDTTEATWQQQQQQQAESRAEAPQKVRHRASLQSSNFTSRYFTEGNKNAFIKISPSPCLLHHHLPQQRYG